MLTACGPKKYSFKVDAPPKYSSKYVLKSMTVKDFRSEGGHYAQTMIDMLKNGIAKEGYIKIVQHGSESILSGTVQVGRVSTSSDSRSYSCKKKIDGQKVDTTCYSYTYTKKHHLKVDYSLYSSRDNSVIFGESVTEEFDDSWTSYTSASDARNRATTDSEIISKSLATITQKIVNAVSPHKETISRELEEGSSDSLKLGIMYVENGRVEQALSIWNQCISQSKLREDIASAYYNIGVIKESKGAYRDAFSVYSQANVLMPTKELYIKAMTRAETLNQKNTKVRQWKQQ